jgi:adenylate cyclase
MLYNQAERLLELRAATNEDLSPLAPHYDLVDRVAHESLQEARLVYYNDLSPELHSIMCLPLILNGEIIGVLGVLNCYGRHGFSAEDRRLLSAIASQMDTAIFESIEQRRLRRVLGRSVDPHVMERLLSASETEIVNCERSVLTVLYADIRGSTALAEHTEPDLLVGFINDYLSQMTDIILSCEGTLDKFVGDEVMALFGAPFPQPDHALRAIHVALQMQQAHQGIMKTWDAQGVQKAPIGIGIATGELIVGELGCLKRTDYSVIGRAANLGARICSAAKGGQILISEATYELVKDEVEAVPIQGLHFKGVNQDVTVYEVQAGDFQLT